MPVKTQPISPAGHPKKLAISGCHKNGVQSSAINSPQGSIKRLTTGLAYLQRAAVQIMPDSAERLTGVGRGAQILPNHQTCHASASNRQNAKQKSKHTPSMICAVMRCK
jgi:hypothetical protein